MYEVLESRCLFAGAIYVVFNNNEFSITGDKKTNRAEIGVGLDGWGEPYTNTRVQAIGTKLYVNGVLELNGATSITRLGIVPTINMGSGDDFVEISGGYGFVDYPPPPMTISMGEGDDHLSLDGGQCKSLSIDAGAGDDTVTLQGVVVNRGTSIFTGPGRDKINIENRIDTDENGNPLQFRNRFSKLQIVDHSGPLRLNMSQALVRKQAVFATGNAIDRLRIDRCDFLQDVLISTRGGNDLIDLTDTRFRAGKDVDAGTGDNTVV
ncbi:MAG TPA: hypothetical protein VF595_18200 [Tepidisphaeraceae bacterium]